MDNLRIILFVALALVGVQIYTAWQEDHKPEEQSVISHNVDVPTAPIAADVPEANQQIEGSNDLPETTSAPTISTATVRVVTDVLDIIIDTKGGNIVQTNLLDYPQEIGSENTIRLQNSSNSGFYTVQSGLLAKAGAPNHYAQFNAQQSEYILADGQDVLTVPLSWNENGIKVTKLYTFKRSDYLINETFKVTNNTQQEWAGNQYRQIQRSEVDDSQPFLYTYTGGVYYNEEDKYEKVEYDDMEDENLNKSFDNGWAAMIQHYFMTALIPTANETNKYYSKVVDNEYGKRYVMGLTSTKKKVAPAETIEFKTGIYIGPKILDRLDEIAPGLGLAVDFGILTIISKPMYIALNWINTIVGNWGWAIVILTIGLKILFFPLANASYKSMAKMKKVMPEVQKLKEKYGDDRQRIAKEQMALFQKHKVNPAAGCFPMLIQMPVFMGLYWALLESVQLRQAPFILWINDLSIADPYFILPVIMGASMFIQQKLNPPPADPMQAKMMQMMPIMFSVFFFFLPVGLVLYSVTNNTLSIIQQYVITKRIENE